ncbi:methyl-accepting chemotaxis protein [Paenibacillus sp. HWE-109]|uniref:methyl-accepting chemotaxis protein n=1 Tax=Paenibacillus sp. HWE-109 TaxID=1306526 RepID=UPI001EDFE21B|nr:methyl-accepting chemotaxis protein [Paenibacillus sp. HWE-109]UKS27802.1 methyl-accepting chemotaxis protein [Paenibacillus sp. HWE-109]
MEKFDRLRAWRGSHAFKPAISMMNKLRYPQKFFVIGGVFVVPILILTVQLFMSVTQDIRTVKREMRGIAYQGYLGELMIAMDTYSRSLGQGANGGPPANSEPSSVIKERTDRILSAMKQENGMANALQIDEKIFKELTDQWTSLTSGSEAISQNFYEIQHEGMEQHVMLLMEEVSQSANLALDPELVSHYLIDLTVDLFPDYWTKLEKVELIGKEVAVRGQIKNPQEQEDLIRLSGDIEALLARITSTTETIQKKNPELSVQMGELLDKNRSAASVIVDILNEKMVNAGVIQITPKAMLDASQEAKQAGIQLYQSQRELLNNQLQQRVHIHMRNMVVITVIILAMLVCVAYLFAAFYLAVKRGIDELGKASIKLVEGDLTVRVKAETKDEFQQVIMAFNNLADSFMEVVGQSRVVVERAYASSEHLKVSVQDTTRGSQEISTIMVEVAAGSEVLVQAAEETSTAMSEVSSGIQRIAETSSLVAEAATEAADEARQGYIGVNQAIEQMDAIKIKVTETSATLAHLVETARHIDRILEVIRDISEQTRLLALNASIEAARAGEHGRGFQVVATEVRKLADQSSESVKQIAHMIASVQFSSKEVASKAQAEIIEVEKGGAMLTRVGTTFDSILKSVDRVAEQIQEVSAASEQISASTEQVSASMEDSVHISKKATAHTQNVKASLMQQVASTREVAASSDMLNQLSNELLEALAKYRLQ